MSCYGTTLKGLILLRMKHMLKHKVIYLNEPHPNGWATVRELSTSLLHSANTITKRTNKESRTLHLFHCWFVPNLHRNTEAHTSFHSSEHSGWCRWRDPAHSCFQNAPFAAAPLLRAGKIEAVVTSPSIQRAVGMVSSIPKLCSATAALQLCPFSDSAFMSMAITHLILDLHEIKLHTCEMQTAAKHP